MNILTDEEMKELHGSTFGKGLHTFARAIESAVLEKLRQQEPVAWAAFADNGNIRIWSSASETMRKLAADESMKLTPLYAIPVPAAAPAMQEGIK